jgi:hypothetical protein
MNRSYVFVGIILFSSLGAFFYLRAKEDRQRPDKKDTKKEIGRWEGEGGSIRDCVS